MRDSQKIMIKGREIEVSLKYINKVGQNEKKK